MAGPAQFTVLLALTSALALHGAHAQDDDWIQGDRPDFVDSSKPIKQRQFQVEAGYAVERDRQPDQRERTGTTPVLLRYGLSASTELRIETEGWIRQRVDTVEPPASIRASGMADSSVTLLWNVLDGADGPSLGLLFDAELPSGARAFQGHGVRPSVRMSAEWELGRDTSLGIMPGLKYDTGEDGRRFTAALLGINLQREWGPRWRGFVEVALPQIAHGADGGTRATFNTGLGYRLSPRCAIDVGVFRGLNSRSPDLQWTVGLAYRL